MLSASLGHGMSSLDFGWGMKLQNQSKHYNVTSMSSELHLVWPLQSLSSMVKPTWGQMSESKWTSLTSFGTLMDLVWWKWESGKSANMSVQVSNIGFITVHGLNKSHIAPYTDIELAKYQTYIIMKSQDKSLQLILKELLQYWQRLNV